MKATYYSSTKIPIHVYKPEVSSQPCQSLLKSPCLPSFFAVLLPYNDPPHPLQFTDGKCLIHGNTTTQVIRAEFQEP